MPRPLLHDPDAVLDAVRDLLVEGGPRAAGIRAIAERSGAPSGSLYHRFGSRDELVARAWLRAVRRFQDGYVAALEPPATFDAPAALESCAARDGARDAARDRARDTARDGARDGARDAARDGAERAVRWAVAFVLEQPADANLLLRFGR